MLLPRRHTPLLGFTSIVLGIHHCTCWLFLCTQEVGCEEWARRAADVATAVGGQLMRDVYGQASAQPPAQPQQEKGRGMGQQQQKEQGGWQQMLQRIYLQVGAPVGGWVGESVAFGGGRAYASGCQLVSVAYTRVPKLVHVPSLQPAEHLWPVRVTLGPAGATACIQGYGG